MVPQPAVSDCAKFYQVYSPPKTTFECFLEAQEICEAICHLWLEFHEHVDVTVLGIEILAQDRTEYLELAHAVKAAQPADLLEVAFDQRGHGT